MLSESIKNGAGPEAPPQWREEAINRTLAAQIHYAEGEHVLLREIRRNRPGCFTLSAYPDRDSLRRFLRERTDSAHSLLTGRSGLWYVGEEEAHLYLGWYGLDWEGTAIEVALTPNSGAGEQDLFGAATASDGSTWAAGWAVDPSSLIHTTLIEHEVNGRWSIAATPNPGSGDNGFGGIAAVPGGGVWAVGVVSGNANNATLIEHEC